MPDDIEHSQPEMTDVMYRWWRPQGDDALHLIAIFPGEPGTSNEYTCSSYEQQGQHGAADPQMVIRYSKPASIGHQEVRALDDELRRRGYNLRIIERHDNAAYLAMRRAKINAQLTAHENGQLA